MNVLVAGATEFFAPFVIDELRAKGHEITILTTQEFETSHGVSVVLEDTRDSTTSAKAIGAARPDVVIDMSHDSPGRAQRILDASSASGGARTVHLSSISVYGSMPTCPVDEETPTLNIDEAAPDIAAQIEADEVISSEIIAGRPSTLLRLPHLYGPRDPRCAEWFFAKRALDERPRIAVPNGGLAICHRGFVQNMARAVIQAATANRAIVHAINVGEEKLYTLAQLARGIARALDHKWDIYSVPGHLWRTPYDYTCFFDLRRARGNLRYRDAMIPRDGLELTLAWLCQNPIERWNWPTIDAPFDYEREENLIAEYGEKLDI